MSENSGAYRSLVAPDLSAIDETEAYDMEEEEIVEETEDGDMEEEEVVEESYTYDPHEEAGQEDDDDDVVEQAPSPRSQQKNKQRTVNSSNVQYNEQSPVKEVYSSTAKTTTKTATSVAKASNAHDDALKAAIAKRREHESHTSEETLSASSDGSFVKGANTTRETSLMFNYDDDFSEAGAAPVSTPEDELTWRLDPVKSLSDWTITVNNRETREFKTFHVHRNVLAVGKRKSEYFVQYFQSHDRLASSKTGTEIYLEKVAAKVMPEFLDYMYSTDDKLNISTDTAIGLRHLAQFFGIRPLHVKVMEFILGDLNMDNVDIYYRDSVSVDDDKVAEMAAKQCAKNILQIKASHQSNNSSSSLLNNVDAHFFRRIMSSPEIDSKEKHYHISALLAEFVVTNKQHLDEQDFVRLTDEQYLKHIEHQAAMTLLEVEADLGLAVVDEQDPLLTTALQKRCVRDLTQNWQALSKMKQETVLRVFRKLPSTVVSELLVKSLAQARKAMDGSNSNSSNTGRRHSSNSTTPMSPKPGGAGAPPPTSPKPMRRSASLRDVSGSPATGKSPRQSRKNSAGCVSDHNNSDVAKIREEYESKMEIMRREHDKALSKLKKEFEISLLKLRDMVLQKDKDVSKYTKELLKFERLPNSHGGKLLSSNEKNKPVSLPILGPRKPEGVIYSKKDAGGRFPLFYYNHNAE